MCPWLLERSTVNYFKIFKSLNFEGVQDVKLNRKERLIESNISDKMLYDWSSRVKLKGSLPQVRWA